MSRIGKKPVAVPSGVKVAIDNREIKVEGAKGQLSWVHPTQVAVAFDAGSQTVVVTSDLAERMTRALHGLTRALVQNMVIGVSEGYEKKLEVVGVGYLAAIDGDTLQLRVGFANEIHKKIPKHLDVTCPDQTHIVVRGCDKQQVGQFAAEVRAVRKPEPYKGKGVRYDGEHVKLKPGKTAT